MTFTTPLLMQPVFRDYPWGGTRLKTAFGKATAGRTAESWEVVDRGEDQSRVAAGPLAGKTLGELFREHGEALLGRKPWGPRFPLFFKWLNTAQALSVQVHPDDLQAERMGLNDLGKIEAWYIVEAAADSRLHAGLKEGVGRAGLVRALEEKRVGEVLHEVQPRLRETYLIRPGTVHALGAGLIVGEIQSNSDQTFRLHDWDRVDAQGKSRALHVEQSLAVLDEEAGPVKAGKPKPLAVEGASTNLGRWLLAECHAFRMERWKLASPLAFGGDGKMRIVAVVQGALDVEELPEAGTLGMGKVLVCPAAAPKFTVRPYGPSEVLVITIPEKR